MIKEPKKLFYKIGEVCKLAQIEPHVLRYWENEFRALSPAKNNSGRRIYRPRDVELVLQIKKLLYEDGYTIAGANKKILGEYRKKQMANGKEDPRSLAETGHDNQAASADGALAACSLPPLEPADNSAQKALAAIKAELENLLTLLDKSG